MNRLPATSAALLCSLCLLACDSGSQGDPRPDPEYGFCEPNPAPFPVRGQPATPASLPFLHVDGTDVVDEDGNRVALRGFNFGSWLMNEAWIPGIGLMDEDELLDALQAQADALGVGALLQDARNATLLDWVSEARAHWVLVQEWRAYTAEHAGAEQQDAVARLWEWFDAQPWIFEERSLWKWLRQRFGYARSEQLRSTFYDHYITELDVQRIAGLGLNLIRVPIWYDALESDWSNRDNGFKLENWRRLDALVEWARAHEVYLMLDLHGAPGGQSTSWHQGLEDGGVLWHHQACIDKTARLWQALAAYFEDEPHVAVYDLLNEPMSAPDAEYATVHDAIYRAIREKDTRHIVMIEDAYRQAERLTSPSELGWSNAMFSVHDYPGGTSAQDYLDRIDGNLQGWKAHADRYPVPFFLGEFNAADGTDSASWAAEGMDLVLARLNQRGIHWAPWTWKYYNEHPWGIFHPASNAGYKIDVRDASFEQILADFEALDSASFEAHAGYEAVFRARAAEAPAPRNLE